MQTQEKSIRIINHKTMRVIIGFIALQMPFTVAYLSGHHELKSISISYWTPARDVFVGSLVAVGFFLSAYNGTGNKKDLEYWASKVAWFPAICIALFPTGGFDTDDAPEQWIQNLAKSVGTKPEDIHNIATIIFFLCLIVLMFFFSHRAKKKSQLLHSKFALVRSRVYLLIGLSMLIIMPSLYHFGKENKWNDVVYWVEFSGLMLFGIGWLLAGFYHTVDCGLKKALPPIAEAYPPVEVDPAEYNTATEIIVEAGEEYIFEAEGCWRDWFITCGPNGWGPKWNPLALFSRVRWQPFFMLCGNIGRSEDKELTFCIGNKSPWKVPENVAGLDNRRLYLFANDWKCRYGNNKALEPKDGGPLKVTIYRLKSDE